MLLLWEEIKCLFFNCQFFRPPKRSRGDLNAWCQKQNEVKWEKSISSSFPSFSCVYYVNSFYIVFMKSRKKMRKMDKGKSLPPLRFFLFFFWHTPTESVSPVRRFPGLHSKQAWMLSNNSPPTFCFSLLQGTNYLRDSIIASNWQQNHLLLWFWFLLQEKKKKGRKLNMIDPRQGVRLGGFMHIDLSPSACWTNIPNITPNSYALPTRQTYSQF